MERKISDKFDFVGYSLEVEKSDLGSCKECFFYYHKLSCYNQEIQDITGECSGDMRQDGNDVIFVDTND